MAGRRAAKGTDGPRILVVGCGSIGKRHLANLQRLGVAGLGGVDTRQDRRQEVIDRLGISHTFSSLEEALEDPWDAVLVGVPTSLHVEVARAAIERGAHVLVEKPISHRSEGLGDLLSAARRKRRVVMVGYSYRFWPPLAKVKDLVEAGAIGRVYSVQVTISEYLPDWHPWEDYRQWFMAHGDQGGGAILDESHAIDLVRWILGEVDWVVGVNGRFSDLEITADDLAEILVRFRSGAVGSLHLDIFGRDHRKEMAVMGERGNIYWDSPRNEVRVYHAEDKTWQTWKFSCERNDMFVAEAAHFLECIAGRASPPVDGEDATKTLAVALAAVRSSETGRGVRLE